MIGSGLKKLALENGMKVDKGVAYGSLRGYAATLSEGSGYKQISVTTKFSDTERLNALQAKLNGRDISRELRVRSLTLAPNGICIIFNDTVGTMKKIQEFIDWFFPLLDESSASGAAVCTECGMPITAGRWVLIDGTAFYLHDSCAERVKQSLSVQEQERMDNDSGSYLTGLLGALAGSALGAVVWAVVLCVGYVASLVGLLIGWLAEKGYNLLRGKQGKAKIAILVLVIVLGVIAGTLGGYVLSFVMLIAEDGSGLTYGDIPMLMQFLLSEDEYRGEVISTVLQGLLFAALGAAALLIQENKKVSGTKVVDLK